MRSFQNPRELLPLRDVSLGTSEWLTLDQARIDLFAEATGDHQWIHVDPERAAAGPYGATIAHGYLTLSLLPVLGATVYEVPGVNTTINYGLNRVRFTGVVPVGSRVRAHLRLVEAQEKPTGVQVLVEYTMERQGTDRPVLVAEQLRLLVP